MVDLDLPSKPQPPLTSFAGFRSRIMAAFMSFLTRRHADRTTSMFGICVFMLKQPAELFRRNVSATSPGESKPKSCLIACVKAARITNRALLSVRSHPREADGRHVHIQACFGVRSCSNRDNSCSCFCSNLVRPEVCAFTLRTLETPRWRAVPGR